MYSYTDQDLFGLYGLNFVNTKSFVRVTRSKMYVCFTAMFFCLFVFLCPRNYYRVCVRMCVCVRVPRVTRMRSGVSAVERYVCGVFIYLFN